MVRHPPVAVPDGVCYGRLDVPLRPGWEGWARALAGAVADARPERLLCSPAQRCVLPAGVMGHVLGLDATIEPRLAELDFGTWEGQPWDHIDRAGLDRWAAAPETFAMPSGESASDLQARVRAVWDELRMDGRSTMIVTHGGPLRYLLAWAEERVPDPCAAPPVPGAMERFSLPPR
nr:histidine phosphatase family protein [Ameyamaea chiangmaiensis]